MLYIKDFFSGILCKRWNPASLEQQERPAPWLPLDYTWYSDISLSSNGFAVIFFLQWYLKTDLEINVFQHETTFELF